MSKKLTVPVTNEPIPSGVPPKEKGTAEAQQMVNQIIIGVVVVLLIGFAASFISVITLWVQALHDKDSSYHELETQIQDQNAKIDILIQKYQK